MEITLNVTETQNIETLKDLVSFLDEIGIVDRWNNDILPAFDETTNSPWCYNMHLVGVGVPLPADLTAAHMLQIASEEAPNTIISFSVTDKEELASEYMDALEYIPGATITELFRPTREKGKGYYVYLCSFPTSPEL